jgi:capsule polysaccharide export protein KpsE/RkpR
LKSVEEQVQQVAVGEVAPIRIPISITAAEIWQQRRRIAIIGGIGLVLSAIIAFLIPEQFQSTAQLMPPDPQTFTRISLLNPMSGSALMLPGMGSGLLNTRTAADTAIGVLSSEGVQDDIINRFDLRKVYNYKFYVDTRKKLAARSKFSEDKKSGIITISVLDHDRNRARSIAQAYIEDLDKLANTLNTSAARRERIFLEGRLQSIKVELDQSAQALSQFSSKNATLDIPAQGQATLAAVGRLQAELIVAQSQLSGLQTGATSENPMVQQAQGRVNELQKQLRRMAGTAESLGDGDSSQVLPSVRKLPLLGLTYYDLLRKTTMEQALYETLTRQYELAKVQEAQEIPPIKVLDAPDLPEKKYSPHRLAIMIAGAWLAAMVEISRLILLSYRRKSAAQIR